MQETNNTEAQQQTASFVQESNKAKTTQTNLNEDKPKQNSFLITLLSILLLLACSIAGFFAYQTQTLVKELTSMKATSTPVSVEEQKDDPTSDWKTYTNEKQNVTFKYPQTWKLVEKEKGDDVEGRVYNSSIQLVNDGSTIDVIFDLSGIGGGPRNVPYDEIELWGKEYYMQYGNMNFEKNTKTINISDSPTGLGAFQVNSKTYMISLTYEVQNEGEKPDEKLFSEFNQILSTFKFTN